jgi:methoxymalonate biosynthesis protein
VPPAFGAGAADTAHYLRPDDFVALEIGWGRKSDGLRRLAADLGITLDQLAFVDDHPVEREEVRQALPQVFVLGDRLERVREALLTSPRFQVLHRSAEAAERTATTRARLRRDEERATAGDHAAFLASLQVRCSVRRETGSAALPRVAELLRRTSQLHTGGRRPTEAELLALVARPDADVWTLTVADRFGRYGIAGAALVEGARVTSLAISCRVLGLEVEPVLLRRALASAAARGPQAAVDFTATDRNLPARRLFDHPGFAALPDGSGYALDPRRHALPADPPHCTVVEEASPACPS